MITGSLRSANYYGRYWANTAYMSESSAYSPYFSSANILPSDIGIRYLGFTVKAILMILKLPNQKFRYFCRENWLELVPEEQVQM